MIRLFSLILMIGVATTYTSIEHAGNPLFCDTAETWLHYNKQTNFIAIPVGLYKRGYQCGDLIKITFPDGNIIWARSYDAGPFGDFAVRQPDGTLLSIVVDIPEHIWPYEGTSHPATIINVDFLKRIFTKYAGK